MNLAIVSLIILVIVVAIRFVKKVNLDFLSLGVAFTLDTIGDMNAREISNGFSSSMFITLVGITFLFGMASNNGTLELFSKKTVTLIGKSAVLVPTLMFILSAFISTVGPGHIAAGILTTTFAVYLTSEMKINPIATALHAKLGVNTGYASPLSLTGVLTKSLSEPLGYSGFDLYLLLSTLISGFIFTLTLYVAFKGYRVKTDNPLKFSEIPRLNREQRYAIISVIVMVVCYIGFKLDTGLSAFVVATVLILLGYADGKKAIKSIPWGTLVFICGVDTLVNVINTLGGIEPISNFLIGMMGEETTTPILSTTLGILSWVGSTTGVIIPALFPTAADAAASFTGSINHVELVFAVVTTSFTAAVNPLLTGGVIIVSSYSAARETTNHELNEMLKQLSLLSVGNVLLSAVLSTLGLFNLGGLFY